MTEMALVPVGLGSRGRCYSVLRKRPQGKAGKPRPPAPAGKAHAPEGGGPKACAGLRPRVGAAAWIVDTGANDDIADPTADTEGKILESWVPREKEVLEAVGKQVTVQEHGRVSIPHFGEANEALLVPNSPNCMAVGKRIRLLEYGFTW